MQLFKYPGRAEWKDILSRPVINTGDLIQKIKPVLEEVKQKGDEALMRFTREFDQVEVADFRIPENDIFNTSIEVPEELKRAIDQLRHSCKELGGSIGRIGDRLLIITPNPYIRINN